MKLLIGAILGGAIVVAVVFFMNQPEPTPEERLGEAAQQAGQAAKEAADALADAAEEATGALAEDLGKAADDVTKQLETASADLSTRLSASSAEAQAQLDQIMSDWKATGILTDEGIDFDKANAAIASSDLAEDAKSGLAAVLEFLRTAPGAFDERLKEVDAALEQ